tara:strand:+ start:2883 stop:3041 length:159 start_codon:yes stop_codon:yes gene_type:complete
LSQTNLYKRLGQIQKGVRARGEAPAGGNSPVLSQTYKRGVRARGAAPAILCY